MTGRLLGAAALCCTAALVGRIAAPSTGDGRAAPFGPAAVSAIDRPARIATGPGPVVDHRSVAAFLDLTRQEIAAAAGLRVLFIDHSVGANIDDGLTCTASQSLEAAPGRCRRFDHVVPDLSADPSGFRFGTEYDRSRWLYHFGGGSYWSEWEPFVGSLLSSDADWDVVIPMPSYLVAPNGGWEPIASLEAAYPGILFVYATSSLPRGAAGDTSRDLVMQSFNEDVRAYARARGKPLLDVADILSHDYRDAPCFDTRDGVEYCQAPDRCENLPDDGVAIPAICQHYTSELFGGHLGSVSGGALRMSQAMWLLMARISATEAGTPHPTEVRPGTTTAPPSTTSEPTRPPSATASPFPTERTTDRPAARAIHLPLTER